MAVRLDVAQVALEDTGQSVAEDTNHRCSFLRRGFGFVRLPGHGRREAVRADDPFTLGMICPHTAG